MAVCISQYREAYQKALGKKESIEEKKKSLRSSIKELTKRADAIVKAQVLIQKVALETQAAIIIKIEAIVNKVLQAVFPEYSFELVYEIKRNKSEAVLKFYKGENEIDLMEGDGGGLVDVAAMALRLAVWSLSSCTDTLLLDEMGKWVSRDLQPVFAEILAEISHQLGIQVILVTHSPDINDKSDNLVTIASQKEGQWLISKVVNN